MYLISGGFDLLVTLEGKSLKEVSAFVSDKLSTLDSILSTATHFIPVSYTHLDVYKRQAQMPESILSRKICL